MTEDSSFSFTWGLDLLNDIGHTRIFNFMLRRYTMLGLSRLEMLCLIHLASYHYESPIGESKPSLVTIAKQMGYSHRRHVSRLVAGLEHKGMLSVTRRLGDTSIYNARPFAVAAFRLWMNAGKEEIQDIGGSAQNSTTSSAQNSTTPVLKRAREEEKKDESKKRKREVNTDAPNPEASTNSRGAQNADLERLAPLRGETDSPKRVIAGTGDSQRDHVDTAAAGVSAVQAKELVARAMYQVVTPDLEYPDGKTKRAKEARRSAEIAAGRVLERIGRENHQDALDACHLLLTEPTDKEAKWLDSVSSVYGLVDTVTKRVSQLRGAARERAAAIERNKLIETIEVSFVNIGPVVNVGADVPQEYADIWREMLEDMELQSGRPETLLRRAVLQEVTEDMWIIDLNNQVGIGWARLKLKPAIERALGLVAGRPMQVSFVARNGVEHGNQDENRMV